jgi:hypothetical protein
MIELLSWVAAITLFVTNFFLIKTKSWKVFIAFIVANSMYAIYWTIKHEWATLALVTAFIIQNVIGLVAWYKESHKGD